jgi:hypothetical protein
MYVAYYEKNIIGWRNVWLIIAFGTTGRSYPTIVWRVYNAFVKQYPFNPPSRGNI